MPPAPPCPVDREVGDGDLLPFGGGALVVHAPGHTDGSIGLHLPGPRVLFTGDTVAETDGAVVLGPFNLDRRRALASFHRLVALDADVTLAEDVTLLPGTQLHGATSVAAGATIGPDTTLTDTEVGEDAVVKRADATLSVIGARASVGPWAYLRPNSVVGEDGKIGTFVETKNTQLGAGSKVPHLSYLGDAVVGEQSNIGAGTITANYDGVQKHATRVGSHVRTGSHNVFVAPVSIGDGAYTGAGTVVRKDVEPGALAISVAPQRPSNRN